MRKYKEKDVVNILWNKTPFETTALANSLESVGVVKGVFKINDWNGDTKDVYVITGYDARDKTKPIMLFEHEISLYVSKVSEGDVL